MIQGLTLLSQRNHLKVLKKATAAQVWHYKHKKYEMWYPATRQTPETHLGWTPMQWSFLRAMDASHIQLFNHRVINVSTLAQASSLTVEEMTAYLKYIPGLLQILTLPGQYHRKWVLQFYADVWIDPEHKFIEYIFNGNRFKINTRALANMVGARAEGQRIHQLAYPEVVPPRRPYSNGIYAPDHETTTHIFMTLFGAKSERHPSDLT